MEEIDVLYIDNITDETLSIKHYNSWPLGIVGLLDVLNRNGYKIKAISDSTNKVIDPEFNLLESLKKQKVRTLIMIDIWNSYILHSKIQTIKKLKTIFPNTPIVVGGQFASFFYQELMDMPEVDFLIRGDAEKPILDLVQQLASEKNDFSTIPNLVYKNNGKVIANKVDYFISSKEINAINYTNFELLPGYIEYWKNLLSNTPRGYFMFIMNGKGCKYVCKRCNISGNESLSKYVARTHGMVYRSIDNTKKDIEQIMSLGIDKIGFSNCILDDEPYRKEFLEKIKFPNMKALFFVTFKSQFKYLPELTRNFHPQSACYFELSGGTDEISKSWGMGNSMEELHELIKTLNCLKNLSFELGSRFVTLQDVDGMIEMMEQYRNNPSVIFSTNIDSARPHGHLNFNDFIELSKGSGHLEAAFNDQQKQVITKFKNEVLQRNLQNKLIGWNWEKEYGV